jgi:preprotein translocase subunit SecB
MTENTIEQDITTDDSQAKFSLSKIYVKDASFEAPNTPEIFSVTNPNVGLELNTSNRHVQEDGYEVVLNATVTAKQDDKVVFIAEVKQAGLFLIRNMEEAQQRHTLGSFCPTILFPYARQEISNLISAGGFPQLLLAHVNFEQLFQAQELRRQEEAQQNQQPAGESNGQAAPTDNATF